MANLGPQHINQSFGDLLQLPNGLTPAIQNVQDGSGNVTPLEISTTAVDLPIVGPDGSGMLSDLGGASGSNFIGFEQAGTGAVLRTSQDKMRETVSVLDFGADPTGNTNSTSEIQAAIDACSIGGTVIFPPGQYAISSALTINKPLTIKGCGTGSFVNDLGSYVTQTTAGANAFTLVATTANYAFGQYGIINVNFNDIAIIGANIANRVGYGIGVDDTVNGGVFHIRECKFTNVNIRYFYSGIYLRGIAYLNDWFAGTYSRNLIGVTIGQGTSGTAGGQTRFFGTCFDLNDYCGLSFLEDTYSGDLSCFGCTFADTQYGVRVNQDTQLVLTGCHFEECVNSGTGAGVYLPISNNSNPNSGSSKNVVGCNFTSNDRSIWVNKTSTAFAGGSFAYAMNIDGNFFGDANALYCTVPSGHAPIDGQTSVLGATNAGPSGYMTASQITNFQGIKDINRRITRRYNISSSWVSGSFVDDLPINMVLLYVRVYLTANASGFTALSLGNQANNSAYALFNAQTQPLNTWVTYNSTLGDVLTTSDNRLYLAGTAGWLGITCVIEIDGYVP